MSRKTKETGFTLIEVLVSMMVMAISLSVIMNLFSGGLRSKKRADDYVTAIDFANHKIQETLLERTIEPGIQEGSFENGYYWKMEISQDDDNNIQGSKGVIKQGLDIYILNVEIIWKHHEVEKIYSIRTLKLEET